MIPSLHTHGGAHDAVYQRGLVIDSQPAYAVFGVMVSISKGIGD